MQIKKEVFLQRAGKTGKSREFQKVWTEVRESIGRVVWPTGSESFTIFPGRKGDRRLGKQDTLNGVTPIKDAFVAHLESRFRWKAEVKLDIASHKRPGSIDVVRAFEDGSNRLVAVEWETGNISSSHRALNKMSVGLLDGKLAGGILVLPTRKLYRHLTDRVGNFEELEPYFPVWRNLKIPDGFLAVIAMEHDATSEEVPRIEKGTDGWALVER